MAGRKGRPKKVVDPTEIKTFISTEVMDDLEKRSITAIGDDGRRYPLPADEKLARLQFMIDAIRDGVDYTRAVDQFCTHFPTETSGTATKWRNIAVEAILKLQEKQYERARGIQIARLEDLYNRCLEEHQYKTAQSVIDSLSKIWGLYKAENTLVVQPVTQFSFGDENMLPPQSVSASGGGETISIPGGFVPPSELPPIPKGKPSEEKDYEDECDIEQWLTEKVRKDNL